MKKKYVMVGLGGRSVMYSDAILAKHADCAELLALCDINNTRMEYYNTSFKSKYKKGPFPMYHASEFDAMIHTHRPDVVIVTSMDRTHHTYICRAMELGCDVISEKPMTTDEEKCRQIFETIERTGKKLIVTFNYRYSPRNTKVKQLIHDGEIGDVISVHFEWMLSTVHGADYFRRWHRDKKNSGGLMVHKATHHFDLVNWWLDSNPSEVFGMGRLAFYGRENAELRGMTGFFDREYGSPLAENNPFTINIKDGGTMEGLYLNAEKDDGYIRDRSVFSQGISIEDTMSVIVRYENKAVMTYSLNAFCPWEGYRISFNGTKGRIEMDIVEQSYVSGGKDDQNNPDFNMAETDKKNDTIRRETVTIQKLWQKAQPVTWAEGKGGHGGGDGILLEDIFVGGRVDPLKTAAGPLEGAKSILVGIAANRSFETRQPVRINDLFPLKGWRNI